MKQRDIRMPHRINFPLIFRARQLCRGNMLLIGFMPLLLERLRSILQKARLMTTTSLSRHPIWEEVTLSSECTKKSRFALLAKMTSLLHPYISYDLTVSSFSEMDDIFPPISQEKNMICSQKTLEVYFRALSTIERFTNIASNEENRYPLDGTYFLMRKSRLIFWGKNIYSGAYLPQ